MLEQSNLRVIQLDGELDLHSVRGMGAVLSEAVGDTSHDPVVDLSGVTFMDSGALAALAKAGEQLRRQGRVLTIVLPDGPVSQLLDLTGLRDRFEVVSAVPESPAGSIRIPAARGGRFAR